MTTNDDPFIYTPNRSLRAVETFPPHEQTAHIENLGRMNGEAMLAQYESAARSVEDMGVEVKDRIGKLVAALNECDTDLKLIDEAAKSIREKGKLAQLQIEEAAALSADVRKTCAEFTKAWNAK